MKDLLKPIALFGGAVLLVTTGGAFFNPSRGATRAWYDGLEKPSFTPPDALFGPVWTILYILIAVAGVRLWRSEPGAARTNALRLWAVQLVLNGLWSPLFFGAKRPAAALVVILLMLVAIAATMQQARRADRAAAWMLSPYLLWVAFATLLNAAIVRLND